MINVLIVDDHPIVRDGLEVLLASEGDFSIHGSVASAEEALAHCAKKGAPDVVVTDVHMPGGMTGLELLEAVRDDADRFAGSADQFDDMTMLCLSIPEK